MRTKILILLLIFLIPESAFSQDYDYKFILFTGIGLSVPTANRVFTKSYRPGMNINLSGCYMFNDLLGARLELQYNHFPYKESDPFYDTKFYSYCAFANLMYGDFRKYTTMGAYAIAGLGPIINSESFTSRNGSSSNVVVNLGAGLGGGVNLVASKKIGMYIEFQYIFNFHEGVQRGYLPFKVGLTIRM